MNRLTSLRKELDEDVFEGLLVHHAVRAFLGKKGQNRETLEEIRRITLGRHFWPDTKTSPSLLSALSEIAAPHEIPRCPRVHIARAQSSPARRLRFASVRRDHDNRLRGTRSRTSPGRVYVNSPRVYAPARAPPVGRPVCSWRHGEAGRADARNVNELRTKSKGGKQCRAPLANETPGSRESL